MKLVLVESPTKARTLSRFLPKDFRIEATYGHIRDLPQKELGVDVEKGFAPKYVVPDKSKKRAAELKRIAKEAKEIILATDPDREGEAIAYHASVILKTKNKKLKTKTQIKNQKIKDTNNSLPLKRIIFHEITKGAIEKAFGEPKKININLVDAQQARRVLDRLVGYKLSPLLWKKIRKGLSAGRVQSVAVRLVVEREKERDAFKAEEFWDIFVDVARKNSSFFRVKLEKINSKKAQVNSEKESAKVTADLKTAKYCVGKVEKKEAKRSPYPPFTTSTLQQAAARYMGWSGKKIMMHAQKLYEKGLITYHRTDSVALASSAVDEARTFIKKEYGSRYVPEKARFFKTKSKLAQEAHEAIRVTDIKKRKLDIEKIGRDDGKLYGLIWDRFVASQMSEAVFDRTKIEVKGQEPKAKIEYLLAARGEIVRFDGWRKVVQSSKKEEQELPGVREGEELKFVDLDAQQKFTKPPARYSEAGLIKKLESEGIGRPSTYAPTISTVQERNYIEKDEDKRFLPTKLGLTVSDFLVANFPEVLDLKFTAGMEDKLDKIAFGRHKWQEVLGDFYTPFAKRLSKVEKTAEKVKVEVEKTGEKCPDCKGGELIIRIGRFGKFIACDKFPKCRFSRNYVEKAGVDCPKCEAELVVKYTKKRKRFYGCSRYPDCDFAAWKKSGIVSKRELV